MFSLILVAVFSVQLAVPHPLTSNADCIIDVKKDLGEPQPILLDAKTDEFRFPALSNGEIEFSRGEAIKLYCSDGFRAPFEGKKSIMASCIAGRRFEVDKNAVDFSSFVCTRLPKHSIRRTTDSCSDGKIAEIGFQTDQKWLPLMRVCHNETIAATKWVQYKQKPANRGYQSISKRESKRGKKHIDFVQADFYKGLRVNNLYSRGIQRDTCSCILGSEPLCMDLMPNEGDFYLSRGHLAARSDFIYTAHQHASYYFLNVAPQWQTFNGGNWVILEEKLKTYIDKQHTNADIYTGTHGVLQYNDRSGRLQDFYLNKCDGNSGKIPVPKIYYKIVVTDDNEGIVFVGINDPHASETEIKQKYIYCKNVIHKVKYIPWKDQTRMGYMYACAIDDFANFVPNLPPLPKVHRLLL